jgi:predicted deacylase
MTVKHLVWTLAIVGSFAVTAQAEPLRRVRLAVADAHAVAVELERAGFDVLEGSVTDGSLDLIVDESYLLVLQELGYEPETIAIGRPFRDILAEQEPDLPPGYQDLNGIYTEMTNKANAYPSICQMVDLTALYGAPTTVEGRHLYAVKVSDNVTSDEDEPAVLIVSCYHAREVVTPVIALHALNQLTSQYGSDPNITAVVNNNEIWIAPVWNPDGYNYMYNTDNMWRKNRRVFAGGTGVDLNRNYPMGWDTACSGDTNPASETYKGPSAASEAETQTMMVWSQGRHFNRVIDYHSSGREVLYAYDCLTHPHTSYLQSEAAALATASGYGGSTRAPSAEGEHYEWQLAYMGAAANLIETHTEFQPSYASAQAEAAMLWPGILWAIQRTVPVWGYVTNAISGEPIVNAIINYVGVNFTNGEYNHSGRFGRYHGYLPAGTYTLSVAAPGYEPLSVANVVVTAGQSLRLDLPLSPPPVITFPGGGEQLPVNVPTNITWTNANPNYRYHVQATTNWGQIGNITDSFERTTLGSDYQTGGNANWAISSQFALVGTRSARAGVIAHNQVSWMSRTASQGSFSFWYLVSSELNGDFFNFYIDGNRVVHASGTGGGWQSYSTTLSAGNHTVKWEYAKNASVSSGNDSVWVDYVQMVSDTTPWTDVIALTPYGATSTPWTPTVLSNNCKVRVRSYHQDATYGPWGESAATFSVVEALPICRGDCDCDGDVDFDDIGYFVAALAGQQAWIDMHIAQTGQPPSCQFANCDVDDSGAVDFDDINPLIGRLGQGCP